MLRHIGLSYPGRRGTKSRTQLWSEDRSQELLSQLCGRSLRYKPVSDTYNKHYLQTLSKWHQNHFLTRKNKHKKSTESVLPNESEGAGLIAKEKVSVTMVTHRNGCCSHAPGDACEETTHVEHPQVHGPTEQHVPVTHKHTHHLSNKSSVFIFPTEV